MECSFFVWHSFDLSSLHKGPRSAILARQQFSSLAILNWTCVTTWLCHFQTWLCCSSGWIFGSNMNLFAHIQSFGLFNSFFFFFFIHCPESSSGLIGFPVPAKESILTVWWCHLHGSLWRNMLSLTLHVRLLAFLQKPWFVDHATSSCLVNRFFPPASFLPRSIEMCVCKVSRCAKQVWMMLLWSVASTQTLTSVQFSEFVSLVVRQPITTCFLLVSHKHVYCPSCSASRHRTHKHTHTPKWKQRRSHT